METVTVVCALVGNKWPDVWVHRLHRMVEKHCSIPFNFRVITDRWMDFPGWGVEFSREVVWTDDHHSRFRNDPRMVLNRAKPQGCWAKLDAFLPEFGSDPVIVLDLDIVIHDDIAKLISDVPAMPEDREGHFNGSIYSFTPNRQTADCYPQFIPYRTWPRGEQEYAAKQLEPVKLEGCYSFKNDIVSRYKKTLPPDAVVTFFHGLPTPAADTVQDVGWIAETWRGLKREDRR